MQKAGNNWFIKKRGDDMDKSKIKELFSLAVEAKQRGVSLGSVFEDFAKRNGFSKGSVRNLYYASLKKVNQSEEQRREYLGEDKLTANKIVAFESAEEDMLLKKILTGVAEGKSVRRAILDITDDPKTALRYQNKYRNLLRYNFNKVSEAQKRVVKEMGLSYDPFSQRRESKSIAMLKKEINGLYDRIAQSVKRENEILLKRLNESREENLRLKKIIQRTAKESSPLATYFEVKKTNIDDKV